jgi:hypothetical protein
MDQSNIIAKAASLAAMGAFALLTLGLALGPHPSLFAG